MARACICGGVIRDGVCSRCRSGRRDERQCRSGRRYERQSASKRGYDRQWRKARARFMQEHPLCVLCLANDRAVPAVVVDHIVPHKGDKKLFWDVENWQSLCTKCHAEKTARGE